MIFFPSFFFPNIFFFVGQRLLLLLSLLLLLRHAVVVICAHFRYCRFIFHHRDNNSKLCIRTHEPTHPKINWTNVKIKRTHERKKKQNQRRAKKKHCIAEKKNCECAREKKMEQMYMEKKKIVGLRKKTRAQSERVSRARCKCSDMMNKKNIADQMQLAIGQSEIETNRNVRIGS